MEPIANFCFPPRFFAHALLLLQCRAIRSQNKAKHVCAQTDKDLTPNPQSLPNTCILPQCNEKNSVKQQPQWSFWPTPGHADVILLTAERVVENPTPSQPSSLANNISREAKGLSSSVLLPSPAVSPQTPLPWART